MLRSWTSRWIRDCAGVRFYLLGSVSEKEDNAKNKHAQSGRRITRLRTRKNEIDAGVGAYPVFPAKLCTL
ncbi:hypothetical protein J6590_023010 [Homalodisca vitripennis]|nr:hypothetical protein J6590_023010 [Homalodisca vitripennis]